MMYRALFAFLLLAAMLAALPRAWSQATPSCGAALAGATLVSQGQGNVPAPASTGPSYSQTRINLSNYALGGVLTIDITVGNGASASSFELFGGNTAFAANGAPGAQPLVAQMSVAAGRCATLILNFSQAGNFVLVATGATGSNTFQYAAYVQPSFAGVFQARPSNAPASAPVAQAARSAAPQAPANVQTSSQAPGASAQAVGSQGSSLFNGVFQPTPVGQTAAQPASGASPTVSTSTVSGTLSPSTITSAAAVSVPASPPAPTPAPAATAPAPVTPMPPPAPAPTPTAAPAQTQAPATSPATATTTPASAVTQPQAALPPSPIAIPGSSPTPAPAAPTTSAAPAVVLTPPGVSVSILDSPAVPDKGGNCIICGLIRGDLTAIEPNLLICARTPNAQQDQACTDVCKRGHTCYYQPFTQPFPSGSMVRISVRNVDQKDPNGVPTTIAYGVVDVASCTMPQSCSLPANEVVYGKGAAVKLSLATGCTPEAQAGTVQTQAILTSAPTRGATAATYKGLSYNSARTGTTPAQMSPRANRTQVYSSSLVDVQTAMAEFNPTKLCTQAGCSCYPGWCNGISIHAKSNVPNPFFVQFFYRQLFDQKGTAYEQAMGVPIYKSGGSTDLSKTGELGECSASGGTIPIQQQPSNCFHSTADAGDPYWVPDDSTTAQNLNNPYYGALPFYTGAVIADSNGDGDTMWDEPDFFDRGASRNLFQGRTFVVSKGQILACVDWTFQNNATSAYLNAPKLTSDNTLLPEGSSSLTSVQIVIFNPPLSKMPDPFAKLLDLYSQDPLGISLQNTVRNAP